MFFQTTSSVPRNLLEYMFSRCTRIRRSQSLPPRSHARGGALVETVVFAFVLHHGKCNSRIGYIGAFVFEPPFIYMRTFARLTIWKQMRNAFWCSVSKIESCEPLHVIMETFISHCVDWFDLWLTIPFQSLLSTCPSCTRMHQTRKWRGYLTKCAPAHACPTKSAPVQGVAPRCDVQFPFSFPCSINEYR